jgi:hypothetical protein
MDDLAAMTHQLEYLYLKKVRDVLNDESMDMAAAKQASIDFLAMEPFPDPEDMYVKVIEFVKKYPTFPEMKEYMNAYQREKQDLAKIAMIREHMKSNNIDAALAAAKS